MKTHLIILADRSGSMVYMQEDAVGGMRTLIEEAREGEGECVVTLIQFDGTQPCQVMLNLEDVNTVDLGRVTLSPRGSTPLFDAIAQAIAKGREAETFVDNTLLAIFTDGENNTSREVDLDGVRALVEGVQEDGWVVTFAGANIDTFTVGGSLGVYSKGTTHYTTSTSETAYAATGAVLRDSRAAAMCGANFSSTVAPETTSDV